MKRHKHKDRVRRFVVLPDTHGELVDRQALECVLQAIEIIRPYGVIHLGDIGEWESVNHHRYKRTRFPDPHEVAAGIRRDARRVRKYVLEDLDHACNVAGVVEKHMITGNHDRWLDQFVEVAPDYADTKFDEAEGYRFDQIFDWANRGWRVHPCGKPIKIGKLHFYHGHLYGGIHHALNHIRKMGVNIVYGHWHDYQCCHQTHVDGPKGAYSLGCLKRVSPDDNEWLEHRPVNWAHMFGVIDFYRNGLFSIHPITIINGRCTLVGVDTVIDGTKPRPLPKLVTGTTNRRTRRG